MQNRDRDSLSQSKRPTDAGEINRRTEEERGRDRNRGTDARFGQSIGRSENNEGGEMRNRDEKDQVNDRNKNDRNRIDESSRREGSGSFGSSTGRSGSVGNRGGGGADISREESKNRRPDQPMGNRDDRSDSSEGRH
jgi:hypothetical protein